MFLQNRIVIAKELCVLKGKKSYLSQRTLKNALGFCLVLAS